MATYPEIVNTASAAELIRCNPDAAAGRAIDLVARGVQQFFSEQPSQLQSPFDLAFFVKVLDDRIDLARGTMSGSIAIPDLVDPDYELRTRPVFDPASDVAPWGIRQIQASNFVRTRIRDGVDLALQATLLNLMNGAYVRQNPKARLMTGEPMVVVRPDFPFDFLFMVMATDYSLRPRSPARSELEKVIAETGSPTT